MRARRGIGSACILCLHPTRRAAQEGKHLAVVIAPIQVSADRRRVAAERHRVAELIVRRRRAIDESRLLRPGCAVAREDIRRALIAERDRVVGRADERRVAVQRHAEAELIVVLGVVRQQQLLWRPRSAVAREDIRRADPRNRRNSLLISADERRRAVERDRRAELRARHAAARAELLLQRPGRPAVDEAAHEDVSRAFAILRHGCARRADERRVAAERHRRAEEITVRAIRRKELGLLRPVGTVAHEDVGRALIGLRAFFVRRADERRVAVERHGVAQQIPRPGIPRHQPLLQREERVNRQRINGLRVIHQQAQHCTRQRHARRQGAPLRVIRRQLVIAEPQAIRLPFKQRTLLIPA